MILVEGETKNTTRNIPTPKADRARFCLTDSDVLELAGYACAIEQHYGRPMDMEWAKDGIDGKLYIVQARPETVASQHSVTALETLRARRPRRDTGRRPLGRRADRLGCGEANREPHAPSGIQARPGAGRRHHHTGLGAGHEDGRGDRHQPRRSHLPRVDHRARTRYPRGGGHRRRDHECARWRGRDGVLRRGRFGPRVQRRGGFPRGPHRGRRRGRGRARRSCSTWGTPTSPSRRRSCPTTASDSPGWSSSSASTSRSIPSPCCTRRRSTTPRRAGRSIGSPRATPTEARSSSSGSPRESARSPPPSGRSPWWSGCRTSRPTSTPACSAGRASSRPRATR